MKLPVYQNHRNESSKYIVEDRPLIVKLTENSKLGKNELGFLLSDAI